MSPEEVAAIARRATESIASTDVSAGSGNDASAEVRSDASPRAATSNGRQWPPPGRSFARTPEAARRELAAEDATLPADAIVTKERVIRSTFEAVQKYAHDLLGTPNKEAIGDYPPESLRVKEARANGGNERFRIFLVWEPNT